MQLLDGELILSPSDLTGYAACEHLTRLDLAVAQGEMSAPSHDDPLLEVLSQRGTTHEASVLEGWRRDGRSVVEIAVDSKAREGLSHAAADTITAMRNGTELIYQATFFADGWLGYADFLERVEAPSSLGDWSYEVIDVKLARSVKPGALLQVCAYSEHVERLQGVPPEHLHVVTGDQQRHMFRTADFAAYYRALKARFEQAVLGRMTTYPEPIEHCSICRWSTACTEQWLADDQLSLVAGMRLDQAERLRTAGINSRTALGHTPVATVVPGIGHTAFERLRQQAELQVRGEGSTSPLWEPLKPEMPGITGPRRGLAALPLPTADDMFFDIEGDPYALDGGLEYLFGVVEIVAGAPLYHAFWAHDRAEEKRAFESVLDLFVERRARSPNVHIYHYHAYEPTVMRRLMGVHGTRETEVDDLLRNEVFADLYRVVRGSVRLSVESYSLKEVEKLYTTRPDGVVMDAGSSIVAYERYLEEADSSVLADLETYNRDDCISTWQLRTWLEDRRSEAETAWGPISRPPDTPVVISAALSAEEAELATLAVALTADVPADPAARSAEQQARWLLAQLLQWHRREDKPQWWVYYHRVHDLSEEELVDDPECIGGIELVDEVGPEKLSVIYRYRFEPQDHKFSVGSHPIDPSTEAGAGEIFGLGDDWIELKRGPTLARTPHPRSLIPGTPFDTTPLRSSIKTAAQWVLDHGIDAPGPYRALRDLLLRHAPRLHSEPPGTPLARDGEAPLATARRLVLDLDHGCLPVQGPPGTGKTFSGAQMILELLQAGQRVGVTATTHSAISNLLDQTCEEATKRGSSLRGIQKTDGNQECRYPEVEGTQSNSHIEAALAADVKLVAGTHWLWARPAMRAAVDVLFVDEAAQMSLANLVAVSAGTDSLVLLGDPQQLAQPSQGTHPEGAGASALQHVLGDHQTIPAELGLFLDTTYRMHPAVCQFISEIAYDNRLGSASGLEHLGIEGEAGLRYVPVPHQGNRTRSPEEALCVARIIDEALGSHWTDPEGGDHILTLPDVIVIAPYNAHVAELRRALPTGARIGTVDKFQGRQGVVAIYSMASSSPDDAPRGMNFLYDLHRINVAISRARAVSYLVCNPQLLRVLCRTPNQMQLANALDRYVEMAKP